MILSYIMWWKQQNQSRSMAGRAGCAAAKDTAKETPAPPCKQAKKRNRPSELETAASDAAKDMADMADATEASAKPIGVPAAVLERSLLTRMRWRPVLSIPAKGTSCW